MLGISKPCLTCGALTTNESRCSACEPIAARLRGRGRAKTQAQRERDSEKYNASWTRLSKRARSIQKFCSDCASTEDLTTDHLPTAWQRVEDHLPIRLQDVDVVCRSCNAKRGSAQIGSERARGDS